MLNKSFILILFLLIISVGMISSVSAGDSADIIGNASYDKVGIEEINNLEVNENDDLGTENIEMTESDSQDSEDVLQDDPGSFTAFEYTVYLNPEGYTFNLVRDYNYYDDFKSIYTFAGYHIPGINIHKSVTINGNGHTINGMSKSVLFYIKADNVVLKNLVFKNAYWSDSLASNYPFAVSDAIEVTGNNVVFDNCTFIGLSGGTNVRALSFTGNKNTVKNCKFIDIHNPAYTAIYSRGDEVTINNCNFTNCISNSYCGAIQLKGKNNIVTKCNFNNCHSKDRGGVIQLSGGKNTISYSNFIKCYADDGGDSTYKGLGGAIYSSADLAVVDYCNFLETSASNNGGAIYLTEDASGATVSNCNFNNTRAKKGGAIYRETTDKTVTPADVSVSNCKFILASADVDGGAIYSNSTKNKVNNCKFDFCTAGSTGGAICFEKNSASSTVSGCDFNNCSAVEFSGAVYWYGSNGVLTKCNFVDCYCEDGGAIYWDGVSGTVSNSNFIRCKADFAGAIDWDGDKATLSNCKFNNCESTDTGAAVYWDTNGGIITKCNFEGCKGDSSGAIYGSKSITSATISECKFTNCIADADGGAILWNGNNTVLSNCEFKGCSADYGGAICLRNLNYFKIKSSTFSANSANYGGAIYAFNTTIFRAESCTFKDNVGRINGGTVWVRNANYSYYDSCSFINNSALSKDAVGGAIVAMDAKNAVINSCNFERNYANNSAGAIYLNHINESYVFSSTFSQNSAKSCGGVASLTGTCYVVSCKFIKNTADEYGGAVYRVIAGDCEFDGNSEPQTYLTTLYPGSNFIVTQTGAYYNNKVVTVTLKGKDGAVLANENVSVVFNGKNTIYKTNSKGQFTIKVTLVPKTYPLSLSFSGNEKYFNTSTKVNVVIKKATPILTAAKKTYKLKVKTKKYTIVLKDNLKKVMKGAVVKLTIKGKTFTAKTNAKGKATFKITNLKKKGSFKGTVKYGGNAYFNAVSKKVTIKVKR